MKDTADEPAEEQPEEDSPEAEPSKPEEPSMESEPTVTVSGGRRRGRRRVMKKKTIKDEEGYLGESSIRHQYEKTHIDGA